MEVVPKMAHWRGSDAGQPELEIDSEKVKTNLYSIFCEKVEKFLYRYCTKKIKNNDYTVSIR